MVDTCDNRLRQRLLKSRLSSTIREDKDDGATISVSVSLKTNYEEEPLLAV